MKKNVKFFKEYYNFQVIIKLILGNDFINIDIGMKTIKLNNL